MGRGGAGAGLTNARGPRALTLSSLSLLPPPDGQRQGRGRAAPATSSGSTDHLWRGPGHGWMREGAPCRRDLTGGAGNGHVDGERRRAEAAATMVIAALAGSGGGKGTGGIREVRRVHSEVERASGRSGATRLVSLPRTEEATIVEVEHDDTRGSGDEWMSKGRLAGVVGSYWWWRRGAGRLDSG